MEKCRARMTPLKLRIPLQALVLLAAVLSAGCRDSPSQVKEGALFASQEKVSPGKALAYVYWPREEQGGEDRVWVMTCDGEVSELLPGGYVTFEMRPGPGCVTVEAHQEIFLGNDRMSASAHKDLGSVALEVEPGRTFFFRLEKGRKFLISRINPRPVEPAVAGPEIRKCRRSIPLTSEELVQQFLQEDDRSR